MRSQYGEEAVASFPETMQLLASIEVFGLALGVETGAGVVNSM